MIQLVHEDLFFLHISTAVLFSLYIQCNWGNVAEEIFNDSKQQKNDLSPHTLDLGVRLDYKNVIKYL